MRTGMRPIDSIFREKYRIFGIELEFIDIIFGAVMITLGVLVRIMISNMESGDYIYSFADWMKEIRNAHTAGLPYTGIVPGGDDHLSTFDYNCLYQYLLVFMNLFSDGGGNDIFLVKMPSIIADVVMAVTFFRIVFEMTTSSWKSMMAMGVCLAIPTVLLNSGAWAQNDSIYTSFLLLSFLSLIKGRDFRTWLYFAIAFCWKQQTVFFAPVLIIAWLCGKLKIRWIFLVPAMYLIVMIPAAITGAMIPGDVAVNIHDLADTGNVAWVTAFPDAQAGMTVLHPEGRTIGVLLGIYSRQVGMFNQLTMNYPNIYQIIYSRLDQDYISMIITAGELVTIMLMGVLAYYIYQKRFRPDNLFLVTLTVFSAELIVFCLPCMHERYGYVAEVFAFIYGMFGWKRLIAATCFQAVTLVTYTRFLWGASSSLTTANLVVFTYIQLFLILLVGYDLYSQIQNLPAEDESKQ
jgi:Gpi18-like mannosyltransferase